MNRPRDHHYIPQFYLKRWCGNDGRLTYFKRINGILRSDRIGARGTGFERDLYTAEHVPPALRQAFEQYVTAEVDCGGAEALTKMRSNGAGSLTANERIQWARFLVSLPIRNPEAVADIKQSSTRNSIEQAYKKAKELHPDWIERDDFKEDFNNAIADDPMTRFLSGNYGLFVMANIMLNRQYQERFLEMHWWTTDFSGSNFSLLTCDRPYKLFRELAHPRCLVYLPLGPDCGFFASPDEAKQKQLQRGGLDALAKQMNAVEVELAVHFVYAADCTQRRFIENRWC